MTTIIGYGTVGQSVHRLFPDAVIIDPDKGYRGKAKGIRFVCVPTPMRYDGSCDRTIVESVVKENAGDLFVIRSTVPPGTTRGLGVPAVFQPEYLGMTTGHHYGSDLDVPFVILGGHPIDTRRVADLYKDVLPSETAIHHTSTETAELVKYATNTFLATKVEFVNELFDACAKIGIEYDELRELWLLDPRIGRSHTAVSRERGFGGVCFPKDISALLSWAAENSIDLPVIEAARTSNAHRK